MENNKCGTDNGASNNAAQPKSTTPQHQPVETNNGEQKTVGIGMPVGEEEMKRLKEQAEKPDK